MLGERPLRVESHGARAAVEGLALVDGAQVRAEAAVTAEVVVTEAAHQRLLSCRWDGQRKIDEVTKEERKERKKKGRRGN